MIQSSIGVLITYVHARTGCLGVSTNSIFQRDAAIDFQPAAADIPPKQPDADWKRRRNGCHDG